MRQKVFWSEIVDEKTRRIIKMLMLGYKKGEIIEKIESSLTMRLIKNYIRVRKYVSKGYHMY